MKTIDKSTVKEFNLQRYLGKWYESPATIIVSNGVCIMSQQNIQNARMGKSKF